MLPPAGRFNQINASITIDVPCSNAVSEALEPVVMRRDGVELPRFAGFGGIPGGVAEITIIVENQIRAAIAVHIHPAGRFVANHRKCKMLLPRLVFALRIFKPITFRAGKWHAEYI